MQSNNMRIWIHPRRFYLVFGTMILIAWGLLVAWQRSGYAELLSHEAIEDAAIPSLVRWMAFLLGWFLMIVAMMLPGSLPRLSRSVDSLRSKAAWLTILGYLLPWVGFGLIAYLGDTLLHQMTEPGMPLAAFSEWIAPAIVLAAGFYQFTPFKQTAMMMCSNENDTVRRRGIERIVQSQAFKHGLEIGGVCVESCWSLMLLMFAVGHHRLDWMLVLGVIMAVERLSPWGRRLSWAVGAVLIIWAIFLVPGTLLIAHSH